MMNKKQIYSTILACVAISAILVASSLIAGIQFTKPALAQTASAPTPSPPPSSSNATAAPKKTAAAAGEPALGKQVNWQGVVSSQPSDLTGRARGQIAVILPPRKDGGLYTGVITYTASRPVSVEVWHQLHQVTATTLIPRQFGAITLTPFVVTGKDYALSLVGPAGPSASVPFTGNGLALHSTSAPFIATYSLTATTSMATVKNNLTSATTAATLGSALGGGGGSAARGATLGGGSTGGSAAGGATLGSGTPSSGGS